MAEAKFGPWDSLQNHENFGVSFLFSVKKMYSVVTPKIRKALIIKFFHYYKNYSRKLVRHAQTAKRHSASLVRHTSNKV